MIKLYPANIYLFKVNNRNTRKRWNMLKVSKKTSERCHWRCSGVFIVNFEPFSSVSLVDFEQVNVGWIIILWTFNSFNSSTQCPADQITGFYMNATLGWNGLKLNELYRNRAIDLLFKLTGSQPLQFAWAYGKCRCKCWGQLQNC